MKYLKIILILNLVFFSCIFVSGLSVNIEVQESFDFGSVVGFSYTIQTDGEENLTFTPYIECESAPFPLLERINLTSNGSYSGVFESFSISQEIEPQDCEAILFIESPEELFFNKSFRINTDPSMEISLYLCKDVLCKTISTSFVKGEEVFMRFSGELQYPLLEATLTSDNEVKELTLPTSVKLDQGVYVLSSLAEQEGFKPTFVELEFIVLEDGVDISPNLGASLGELDSGIDVETLPDVPNLDEQLASGSYEGKQGNYLFYGLGILVLVVFVIILYLIRKRKKQSETINNE